jgi:hypothetical protein
MKFFIFTIITFLISCNHSTKTETKTESTENFSILENDVFNAIEAIKQSAPQNRKKLFEEFLGYASKVDGAVAEGYYNFAFNYPYKNAFDFFSVLTKNDSILIENWAKVASNELTLVMDNIENPDEYLNEFENDFLEIVSEKLNPKKIILAENYLGKLLEYSSEEINMNITFDRVIHKRKNETSIMTSSSSFEPATNIKLLGCDFSIVYNEFGDITYWSTTDTNFITPEGHRVGAKWNELPFELQESLEKMPGWGYYIILPSGWQLGFCEGSSCTDSEPKDGSEVKWIFKRKG